MNAAVLSSIVTRRVQFIPCSSQRPPSGVAWTGRRQGFGQERHRGKGAAHGWKPACPPAKRYCNHIHQPSRAVPAIMVRLLRPIRGLPLNRGPRVRLSRFRELGRHRFDPLRRPMCGGMRCKVCGGMRCKGRHSPFFSPPIFSALRSASRAPIPPAASAVTLQHSSIQRVLNPRAGQRRLEKARPLMR